MRRRLDSLPAELKYQPHAGLSNYLVNQPPLPYLLMTAPDRLMAALPITTRVLVLRLLLSVASVVLIWAGIRRLGRTSIAPFELCRRCRVLRVLFADAVRNHHSCLQRLVGRAGDDLVPVLGVRAVQDPGSKTFAILGLTLSLGLLTKAYFLFVTPLAIAVVCRHVRRRETGVFAAVLVLATGPWFYRNLSLYQNLSGTGEKTAGFGPKQFFLVLFELPWRDSITYMATSSPWTGNNSFTTFSSKTPYVVLLLLTASAALFFYKRSRWKDAEIVVTAAFFHATGGQRSLQFRGTRRFCWRR